MVALGLAKVLRLAPAFFAWIWQARPASLQAWTCAACCCGRPPHELASLALMPTAALTAALTAAAAPVPEAGTAAAGAAQREDSRWGAAGLCWYPIPSLSRSCGQSADACSSALHHLLPTATLVPAAGGQVALEEAVATVLRRYGNNTPLHPAPVGTAQLSFTSLHAACVTVLESLPPDLVAGEGASVAPGG